MDNIYAIIPVSKFKNAKTRLSPFLTEEEREKLLKVMLQDVTDTLKKHVDKIFIISRDEDVLEYAKKLNLNTILEDENSNLNKALKQAMKQCKGKTRKVIIVPSDVPLIGKTNLAMLIDASKSLDFIIVPSKGGGTNMIIMKPMAIHTRFEGLSYKEHVNAAERKKLNPQVHDSLFMALDVNTAEDLGEIMIHGEKTHTRKYLKELKVKVEPYRGSERLKVTRG
ncbi:MULTISPECIES: 2-phospho-L-lactate guanylyltransferase [Methanobrevibacter]|uniref:2-phospho-L-lactate guanylyltransferase n=1 Tax=Methanobrevibacter TaxID=2172 RepID=UPI0025D928EE|nr:MULTISPECIES: 2-phospho-L-lactate guanylyltransferase [Methanobrevibacter]MBS7257006.1 2-phospho-L-lactate guanylyltransferase [Methanobrevibacter sp.]MCI7428091.1 2-phospho-L-lactate guanylyltransferase [Methanobrevibacter sp.]MDD6777222.1 2-phospho-L-lactate guanylyltransferase [Methanobacteriaceae archaeon]MDY3096358.1 2-phospho-L-lactate guanylyltransferase [Methanobrevibacter sp.]